MCVTCAAPMCGRCFQAHRLHTKHRNFQLVVSDHAREALAALASTSAEVVKRWDKAIAKDKSPAMEPIKRVRPLHAARCRCRCKS
jgi:hypothetical protein